MRRGAGEAGTAARGLLGRDLSPPSRYRGWRLMAAAQGVRLLVGGVVAIVAAVVVTHVPMLTGVLPGQHASLAEVHALCVGGIGQVAQAFDPQAARGCGQVGIGVGLAHVLGAVGVGAAAVGAWRIGRRRAWR